MVQRRVEELTRDECFDSLNEKPVGRIVFVDDQGPGALPINYGVAGEEIVFRVELDSYLHHLLGGKVAFEVDHIETDEGTGWSVLIRGTLREIELEQVPDLLHRLGDSIPKPWASGIHNTWLAITAETVTGRRLAMPIQPSGF
jgi:nitroimidazol reductase NimA-like FMN-containing flavoprotein (pyridoxamine 5'-phosphate oxidase superfamily)